jgi:hypothetical protein
MKTALVMFQLKHFRNQPVFRLTNKTFSKTIYIHTIKQYKIVDSADTAPSSFHVMNQA